MNHSTYVPPRFLKWFKFNLQDASTIYKILVFTWVVIKLINFNLWFKVNRLFPRIPVLSYFSIEGFEIIDVILSLISLLLIAWVFFQPKPKLIVWLVFLEVILCVLDLLRFQAFEFQILILSLLFAWQPKKFHKNLLLFLSATYFYAGICKLNLGFANLHWAYFFLEQSLHIPRSIAQIPFIKAIGLCIPLLEAISGLILLTTRYRKLACLLLIGFHVATLLYIGPFGLHINKAVWPWNLAMMLVLWSIHQQSGLVFTSVFFKPLIQKIYLFVIFLLPALGFTNYYHPYASFRLYEGKSTYLLLHSTSPSLNHFHQEQYRNFICKEGNILMASNVTFQEFNVPIPSVPWFHQKVIKTLQADPSFKKTDFYFLPYPYQEVAP